MGVHTKSTTYAVQASQVAAANATRVGSETTAAATLATALSTAQAAYRPNDGGVYVAAITAAHAAYDASVLAARQANDALCATEQQQQRSVLMLP
jgi:hypothetical protein